MLQLPVQEPPVYAKAKGDELKRALKMRTALVMRSPAIGLLAMRLRPEPRPDIPTCATDGKHFYFNPEYISGMSDLKLLGLWGHETLHCTNGHIWRRGSRNPRGWNIACDYAIDQILAKQGFDVPNPLINPEWAGWWAEKIYDVLMKEAEEQRKNPKPQAGKGQPGAGDPGTGKGEPNLTDILNDMFGDSPTKGEVMDAPFESALVDQQEWRQATLNAVKIAKAQGKLPADLEFLLEEAATAKVDWQSVLMRFAQQTMKMDYDFRYPASKYAGLGLYMPRMQSEQVPPIVIGWDTSGSMFSDDDQKTVAGEVSYVIDVVKPERTHVVFFDARVQRVQEFESDGLDQKFKPKGGGGTSFVPVFDWIAEQGIQPACVIMVTDCYGTFPEEAPEYPVMWASTTKFKSESDSYHPPFGEVIHLDIE